MKNILFFILMMPLVGKSQYYGGANDGVSSTSAAAQNPLSAIYKGGSNDGYHQFSSSTLQNALPNIYTGGNDDGVAASITLLANPLSDIYKGGTNDGVSGTTAVGQNAVANIYMGGVNDGVAQSLSVLQNSLTNIYKGGNNDGFHSQLVAIQNPLASIYKGGNDDGYASIVTVNLNPLNPLSTELLSFTGQWQGEDAALRWEVANETKTDVYYVERSTEGSSFDEIGFMRPGNASSLQQQYNFLDVNAATIPGNVLLYRLKIVDKSVNVTYSAIVRLSKRASEPTLILYPNPTTGRVTLQAEKAAALDNWHYRLVSANGSLIEQGRLSGDRKEFDLRAYAAGVYLLSIVKDGTIIQHFSILLNK